MHICSYSFLIYLKTLYIEFILTISIYIICTVHIYRFILWYGCFFCVMELNPRINQSNNRENLLFNLWISYLFFFSLLFLPIFIWVDLFLYALLFWYDFFFTVVEKFENGYDVLYYDVFEYKKLKKKIKLQAVVGQLNIFHFFIRKDIPLCLI